MALAGERTESLFSVTIAVPVLNSTKPSSAQSKDHHVEGGNGFRNPWPSWRTGRPFEVFGTMAWRRLTGRANIPDTTSSLPGQQRPSFRSLRTSITDPSSLRATWLGHASFLVEFPTGFRALFDPHFSARCSPVQWLGPRRYTPAPCSINDLPFVDFVCLSHSHYDHMDYTTLMALRERHPAVRFFVPLRVKQIMTGWGVPSDAVIELDWWDEREIVLVPSASDDSSSPDAADPKPSIRATISCLPCQHSSARRLMDRGQMLWSSWSVASGGKRVWFAGDTGYRSVPANTPDGADGYGEGEDYPACPAFAEIGSCRGPFDLGLLPIGAYAPRGVMSPFHANPMDAVNIMQDTRCERALSMHWGTWVLTEEDVMEPPRKLKEALKEKGIKEEGIFDVCDIGESREFT